MRDEIKDVILAGASIPAIQSECFRRFGKTPSVKIVRGWREYYGIGRPDSRVMSKYEEQIAFDMYRKANELLNKCAIMRGSANTDSRYGPA